MILSEPPTPLLPEEGWLPLWADGVEGVAGGFHLNRQIASMIHLG